MYAKFFKRFIDFWLSLIALIMLSPILLILTVIGVITMRGNPFFVEERPGLHERIFKLIKFRTMSNKKDRDGKLLPDELRLNRYGRILRKLSLDELPELINILVGDMSIVGPRPLLCWTGTARNSVIATTSDPVLPAMPRRTGETRFPGRISLQWTSGTPKTSPSQGT